MNALDWFLIALVYLLLAFIGAYADEQNTWSMTCVDRQDRVSKMSESDSASGCSKNKVTGTAPVARTDGTSLALDELKGCDVFLNGKFVATLKPAAMLAYEHPANPAKCTPIPEQPDPPIPPQPSPTVPTMATATRISTGYRIDCVLPAGTREVRMLQVNRDGSLGSRVATAKACGFSMATYSPKRQYVLKALNSSGQLSGRSELVITK